jgi:hypothetical protein
LLKIQQLENVPPKIVEVVKEVPVEKVVIQEKIVEVIKEVPVETVKEVIVEKIVEGSDKNKLEALQKTLMKIREENIEKDALIKKYEQTIQDIQNMNDKKAVFLRGSNLDDKLYR